MSQGDRFCIANRVDEGSATRGITSVMSADAAKMVRRLGDIALAEQMRSAGGGRRGLFVIRSFSAGQPVGAACRLHRRRGDPLRFQREGRLELTTAPRSQTVATGIPEGFRSLEPKGVAPGGAEAGGSHLLIILESRLEARTNPLLVLRCRVGDSPGLRRTSPPFLRRSCRHRLEWQ